MPEVTLQSLLGRQPETQWHLLSFSLAVQEISQNPGLFPHNASLGYAVYENTLHPRLTHGALLDLLSSGQESIPNYRCGRRDRLLAVLEASESDISIDISAFLNTYKIPQVSHGYPLAVLEDELRFPFFYQMAPPEEPPSLGIVKLLLHFGWTWVGLFVQDNDYRERFRSTLTALMLRKGICVAFSHSISDMGVTRSVWSQDTIQRVLISLSRGQFNACVFYGDVPGIITLEICIKVIDNYMKVGKVWITSLLLNTLFSLACFYVPLDLPMHGSLSLVTPTKTETVFHRSQLCSPLIREFLEEAFDYFHSKPGVTPRGHLRCRERERLEGRPWEALREQLPPKAYRVYAAVQAVGRALQAASSSRSGWIRKAVGGRWEHEHIQPWQVSLSPELNVIISSFSV
ncbi:vomeronasal type-2 receptor 26-like [Paroedura picta]|uniref:vomeronasal type-2 receptor 26-like n=1 Tax=Paroedura picta TaxID=143630 RepID=UPI004055FAAA